MVDNSLGDARPFLLKRNDQFDPGPPLRLDSPKYHRTLAEVEYIGAANSPRTKYKYLFWRPYTAITTGDYLQDPTWTSFWAAPQHPEYPSGHGGQIGSQQGVLDAFLGPRAPALIPLTSPDALGVTRTYADWKTITDDVINARVWEGVHFRTSDIKGVDQGLRLARWEVGRLAEIGL